jgi:hypothetical protein
MPVLVTLTVNGDPQRLEEFASSNKDSMREIVESAQGHGLIAHRFYGSPDGEIMVVDEWPDEQSFKTFFEENSGRIGPMMGAVGVTSEPQPKFWRTLETHDAHGWGA